jgi:pseudouridine kinase
MPFVKRLLSLILTAALGCALLTGCSETEAAGEYTLPVRVGNTPSTLDPIYAQDAGDQTILAHLYENLMRISVNADGSTTVVGGMAKSVDIVENPDGSTTYTFKLRGSEWSDGQDVTANDFLYAWKRLVDPASNSPFASMLSVVAGYDEARATGDLDLLQMEAKNNSTLVITLNGNYNWFLTEVCTATATMPLRPDVVAKLKNHKVNTDYIRATEDGLGTWLAVFDEDGDVFASISKRPDLKPIADILDEHGDEIFRDADSVVMEIDIDKSVVKRVFHLAQKYNKKIFAVVSNMTIALERRDFLQSIDCFVCNIQEAGILFSDDYSGYTKEQMETTLLAKVKAARIPSMIVTMGSEGAVYASCDGVSGFCPARKVAVNDTTGAGDAFCAGAAIGLTYGKNLQQACQIGSLLAASVIVTSENVCPRFLPGELGLDLDVAN